MFICDFINIKISAKYNNRRL